VYCNGWSEYKKTQQSERSAPSMGHIQHRLHQWRHSEPSHPSRPEHTAVLFAVVAVSVLVHGWSTWARVFAEPWRSGGSVERERRAGWDMNRGVAVDGRWRSFCLVWYSLIEVQLVCQIGFMLSLAHAKNSLTRTATEPRPVISESTSLDRYHVNLSA
jgi:hypothetical protein